MKKTISLAVLLFVLVSNGNTNRIAAQQTSYQQALKYYELKDYSQATKLFEQLALTNPSSDVLSKLALGYKFTDQLAKAEALFQKLLKSEPKDKELYFEYADLLRSNADYNGAKAFYRMYAKYNPIVGNYFADQCEYALAQLHKPSNCDLKNLESNTASAEFGPIVVGEEVFHVSQTQEKSGIDQNMVKSPQLQTTATFEKSQLINILEQEAIGRGNASIALEAGMVAFSKAAEMSVAQIIQLNAALQIYFADINSAGQWVNHRSFQYSSDSYSVGFPYLTPDGNTLYFSSNMPGGFGGFDLYVCNREDRNVWSTPQNLGAVINTPGNEISPNIAKGKLFFSSDWHPGFGGFDVFATNLSGIGWTSIENLGSCVNSTRDDYHFILDKQGIAYFTSNRFGGKGGEDVYRSSKLTLPKSNNSKPILDGEIAAKSPLTHEIKSDIKNENTLENAPVFTDSQLSVARESRDKIYFIQITALSKFNDQLVDRFKKYTKYGDIWKVESDNITKIRIGYFQTIGEATKVLNLMKKNGFQDAFIVSDIMDENRMKLILKASSDFNTPVSEVNEEGKFKIRVAEFKAPDWFDSSKLSDLGSIEHWTKGGWTVIILGSYNTESTAKEILAKLKSRGYNDAYVCIENEGKLFRL